MIITEELNRNNAQMVTSTTITTMATGTILVISTTGDPGVTKIEAVSYTHLDVYKRQPL